VAALFAFLSILIVLGLFYYWFALADRYVIFLYDHGMPPLFPDTSPFSRITSSRYWMAGLVASGFVMILYTAVNLIWGRLNQKTWPPGWWQVWLLSALPLAILLPLITMSVNRPVLPLANALAVTLVTLLGLALAFTPGRLAVQAPAELALLTMDGFGLMLIALLIGQIQRLLELSSRGLSGFWVIGLLGIAVGVFLLLSATALRSWRRMAVPGVTAMLIAGLCVAYPLMALTHHLYVGLTGGYFYISDADNFFARCLWPSSLGWLVAALIALLINYFRRRLEAKNIRDVVV
jgi:uncharacterized membrane protein YhaH (DUF805 family)